MHVLATALWRNASLDSFAEAKRLVPVDRTDTPNQAHRPVYERGFRIFQALYERNRPLFRRANE